MLADPLLAHLSGAGQQGRRASVQPASLGQLGYGQPSPLGRRASVQPSLLGGGYGQIGQPGQQSPSPSPLQRRASLQPSHLSLGGNRSASPLGQASLGGSSPSPLPSQHGGDSPGPLARMGARASVSGSLGIPMQPQLAVAAGQGDSPSAQARMGARASVSGALGMPMQLPGVASKSGNSPGQFARMGQRASVAGSLGIPMRPPGAGNEYGMVPSPPRVASPAMGSRERFDAAVAAEQKRLGAEFEELYRERAAKIEAAARAAVVEKAKSEFNAREEALASAAAAKQAEVTSLEGEVLQETVLAEQLQASEEAREAQLREQSRARAVGRPPKPSDRSVDESEALRQLEQKAWRAQNAVRASEAHEDLLQAHRKDLERKLRELQAESDELSAATEADEVQQIPDLQLREADLAERVRQGSKAEVAAQQATGGLQKMVLDLENECGALWLDITLAGNRRSSEAAQLSTSLRTALASPEKAPALSLEQLLLELEAQKEERKADLLHASMRDQDYCELLEGELRDVHGEAQSESEQAAALKAEIAAGSRAIKDAEDRISEAASLRQENEVARRQQQVWHTSQLRMLRVIEDMQRQRVRDVQSQATVAARLAELQRELPLQTLQELSLGPSGRAELRIARSYPSSRSHSPPKSPPKSFGSPGDPNFPARGPSRLNNLWSDNVALKSQIRRLEEEKDDLIKSQEGLIRLVKSKMPTSEQVRESLRVASIRDALGARYPYPAQSVTA